MKKFTYVFSPEDRDHLIEAGYMLLKSDDKNQIYIFKACDELAFALNDVEDFMESNKLTF